MSPRTPRIVVLLRGLSNTQRQGVKKEVFAILRRKPFRESLTDQQRKAIKRECLKLIRQAEIKGVKKI